MSVRPLQRYEAAPVAAKNPLQKISGVMTDKLCVDLKKQIEELKFKVSTLESEKGALRAELKQAKIDSDQFFTWWKAAEKAKNEYFAKSVQAKQRLEKMNQDLFADKAKLSADLEDIKKELAKLKS